MVNLFFCCSCMILLSIQYLLVLPLKVTMSDSDEPEDTSDDEEEQTEASDDDDVDDEEEEDVDEDDEELMERKLRKLSEKLDECRNIYLFSLYFHSQMIYIDDD